MEAQPAQSCVGPISVPRAVGASAPAYRSVAVLGRGDRGVIGCELCQEQGAGTHQQQLWAPRPSGTRWRINGCIPAGSVQQKTCLCSHSVPPQGG